MSIKAVRRIRSYRWCLDPTNRCIGFHADAERPKNSIHRREDAGLGRWPCPPSAPSGQFELIA